MIEFSYRQAADAMQARLTGLKRTSQGGQSDSIPFPDVSIDSRTLEAGQCFFAIPGPRFDGHSFIPQALAAGASALVGRRDKAPPECPVPFFQVDDASWALRRLGQEVRRAWGGPLLAITGSVGKTTTRRFVAELLSRRFKVHRSPGNYNNEFGAPLSLTRLRREHEFAVQELGMNHAGELRRLTTLCRPDAALITNVSAAHLEFFDSLEEIAAAKAEVLESLGGEGLFFFNADDPLVAEMTRDFAGRSLGFSLKKPATLRLHERDPAVRGGTVLNLEYQGRFLECASRLSGRHQLYNLAAAALVALTYQVTPRQLSRALAQLEAGPGRGNLIRLPHPEGADITVWDDSYNSNPKALEEVLGELAQRRRALAPGRLILALGDMLELGEQSPRFHDQAGIQAAACSPDLLVTVGSKSRRLAQAAVGSGLPKQRLRHWDTSQEAAHELPPQLRAGDFLLLKGSRGLKMERILHALQDQLRTDQTPLLDSDSKADVPIDRAGIKA